MLRHATQTPDADWYQHDGDVKRVATETRPTVDWILLKRLLKILNERRSPSRKIRSDFCLLIFLGGHESGINKEV